MNATTMNAAPHITADDLTRMSADLALIEPDREAQQYLLARLDDLLRAAEAAGGADARSRACELIGRALAAQTDYRRLPSRVSLGLRRAPDPHAAARRACLFEARWAALAAVALTRHMGAILAVADCSDLPTDLLILAAMEIAPAICGDLDD